MTPTAQFPTRHVSQQVVLVTGGGRGIGRACAIALASAGAKVAIVARTICELEQTGNLARAAGSVVQQQDLLVMRYQGASS